MINIQNLNFYYDKRHILKDINLKAHENQLLGILGANGCGKSTLLKNMLGFLRAQSGHINIISNHIDTFTSKELAKIISYIPQKSILTMPLKVYDFILAGRYATLNNTWLGYGKEDCEIVEKISNMLHVWHYKDRIATTLSGGEFGRVLLARALVKQPKILLLDEPTSAMDLHFAVEMLKLVKKLIIEFNMCSIIVIHDLNLASLFCDKIAFMKNGAIMDYGDPNDLLIDSKLQKVYDGLECDVIKHKGRNIVVPS